MIKGIGIDIIELERIKNSIEKSGRLAERILTDFEKERYLKLENIRRKTEYLGGRFAAKEACAKALGTGIGKLSFQHIEIKNNDKGAPALFVKGYENDRFFLSISHSREYAVAQVVVEQGTD